LEVIRAVNEEIVLIMMVPKVQKVRLRELAEPLLRE
jgi:hypothetical protein